MHDFLDKPPQRDHSRESSSKIAERSDVAIGFDIGGSNLRAALFAGLDQVRRGDSGAHQVLAELREPVASDRTPSAVASRVATIVDELQALADRSVTAVGVGFAGMFAPDHATVINSPHFGWRDLNFGRVLRDALDDQHSVSLYNDVNAITFGEYSCGVGADANNVLAVFVGTGIGAGMVRDGALIAGASGCGAELGHCKVVLNETARLCACGMRGCLEAYTGGAYLKRRARAELRGGARSIAGKIAGGIDALEPSHLDRAAARGDDYSLALLAELAPLLGAAVANAVTLLNPEQLILGGGMLSRMPVFQDMLLTALDVAINPPAQRGLRIDLAQLGDRAGTLGAALLASAP